MIQLFELVLTKLFRSREEKRGLNRSHTCEYPPPAAPPFIPNVGPCDGCRTHAKTFFFKCAPSACDNPIVVVLFPSPSGVGVIPKMI